MKAFRLTFIKLAILLALIGVSAVMAYFNHTAEYDETLHLDVARNIYRYGVPIRSLGGGEAYLYHPPLFLYIIAPLTGPLADGTLVGRLASAAFGLLGVALTFRLATDLAGEVAGLIAGLLLAISPLFQIYAFNIQAEVMLTALILAGLLAFSRGWRQQQVYYIWLAGVMFGLAAWVKFLAVLPLLACGLFWLIGVTTGDRRPGTGEEIGASALSFQSSVPRPRSALLWPRLASLINGWLALLVPFGLALVLWVGFGLWLDRPMFLAVMHDWFAGPQWPWDPRTHFAVSTWLIVVAGDVLSYPGTLLLLATLPWRVRFYRRASLLALEIYGGLMLAYTIFVSVKEVRHLIPLIPVAAILMGSGLAHFLREVRWSAWPGWARAVSIGVAILFLLEASPLTLFSDVRPVTARASFDPPWAARVFNNDPYLANVRDAGQYLAQATPADTIISVVHEGTVAGYYADRPYRLLYVLSYDQTMAMLAQSEWLLVDKDIHPNLTDQEFAQVKAYIAEHFAPVSHFDKIGLPAVVYQRITPLRLEQSKRN